LPPDASHLADLIVRTGRGDRAAFRAVYDATASKLLGVILRIVKNRAGAEEILQDVYLRLWRNAASYAPEAGPPMGWLVSIARNRAIDVIRQKTPDLIGPDEDGVDWYDKLAEPRDREADMLDASALRDCLGRMDEEHRSCILLAYCEGWSREELAQRFDRPVNTIKTWLHRGLASLRTCLDAQ
jgi:RNA polymerase sigma-70 factor (ECF subfamily)